MKIFIARYDRFEKTVQNRRIPVLAPVAGASEYMWRLICAFSIFAISAQIPLLAEGSNTLTVQLTLKDGYVRVDKSNTTVRLQPDFTNWFSLSKEKIREELGDYLD